MAVPVITAQAIPAITAEFKRKAVLALLRSAAEWMEIPLAIREEAFFSAKVYHAQHVADLKSAVLKSIKGARMRVADFILEQPIYGDPDADFLITKDQIVGEMQARAIARGLVATGPGPMQDITSAPRIRLIVEMAQQTAFNRERFKTGSDPVTLDLYPAQELVRDQIRDEPRDWDARWAEAADAVKWEGVSMGDKKVARKDSPIWFALSAFDRPFPPFDYNSGMGLSPIDRLEAIDLGLIGLNEQVKNPLDQYEEQMQASIKALNDTEREWLMKELQDKLGDTVEMTDEGKVVFRPQA